MVPMPCASPIEALDRVGKRDGEGLVGFVQDVSVDGHGERMSGLTCRESECGRRQRHVVGAAGCRDVFRRDLNRDRRSSTPASTTQ